MKIYRLHTKQNLPITIDEAWDLLSDPKNLQKITPEYIGFKILSGADRPMFPGQNYTIYSNTGFRNSSQMGNRNYSCGR